MGVSIAIARMPATPCIRALQTGQHLRILSDDIAEKTAQQLESYPEQDIRHLAELKAIRSDEGSNFDQ